MQLQLNSPVQYVPRVGPAMAQKLEKLGIFTASDLLYHIPFRYDDFSHTTKVSGIRPEETVTVVGTIESLINVFTKSGKRMQKAILSDETGTIQCLWYNQMFLTKILKSGMSVAVSGKANWFGHSLVLESPVYELTDGTDAHLHTGRLVPIYPETAGVTSKWLRGRVNYILQTCVPNIPESLSQEILDRHTLMPLQHALLQVHFPNTLIEAQQAKARLAFDEMFLLIAKSAYRKRQREALTHAPILTIKEAPLKTIINQLPFSLTEDQVRSIDEITLDLAKSTPMNRLLEGDVGSGKTVVAAIAMYIAYESGVPSILLAPTQILAGQHYLTITKILAGLPIRVRLVTGQHKTQQNYEEKIQAHITIGTHALLTATEAIDNVGLVVIDEQQRFGVSQRTILLGTDTAKSTPHLLTMTATPIPRTLARVVYGEMDLSTITHMPMGRKRITTWVVPEEKRAGAYGWIRKELTEHKTQAFIVCPLIEESETLVSVKAATTEYEQLKNHEFNNFRVGLLHGRMKPKDKNSLLEDFRAQKIDILIATPVVEVGIDIPNATIMVIEAADRFGLSQLHQLRGRVGRSDLSSYCLLFTENSKDAAVQRLKALETTYSGPELAELDLSLRGPGQLFGTRQHGLPDLHIATYTDAALVHAAKAEVEKLSIHLLSEIVKESKIEAVAD